MSLCKKIWEVFDRYQGESTSIYPERFYFLNHLKPCENKQFTAKWVYIHKYKNLPIYVNNDETCLSTSDHILEHVTNRFSGFSHWDSNQ